MTNATADPAGGGDTVSRENYDAHWLSPTDAAGYVKLAHLPLQEIADVRGRIREALAAAIVDHHFHRQRVAERLRTLGHERAADFFASQLPQNNNTRKGNFGEVVASEHLIQRHDWVMPVFKLRFRDNSEMPMRGEDIIAFRIEESTIACVLVGEAKAVVHFRRATVLDAHERLKRAYHPRLMTLSMLAEILYDRGDDDLAQEIDRVADELAAHTFPRENWLFVINEDQPTDVFGCLDVRDDLVPSLHCVNLRLDAMTAFIDDLFDNPVLPE